MIMTGLIFGALGALAYIAFIGFRKAAPQIKGHVMWALAVGSLIGFVAFAIATERHDKAEAAQVQERLENVQQQQRELQESNKLRQLQENANR